MKQRKGFVSNSSSSSFVIVGVVLNQNDGNIFDLYGNVYGVEMLDVISVKMFQKEYLACTDDQKKDVIEDIDDHGKDIQIFHDTDEGIPDGSIVVGHRYMGSEGDIMVRELQDIIKKLEPLKDHFSINDLQIISGTTYDG